jgi:prepilin-type N-terminal cleavage/methylation domain-containing protein/prepilin-type processing-associated H-X9-DG protein
MEKKFSSGFTLFELMMVCVVIAIIMTIAYPSFIRVLERAKITKDMNNLRQIGLALQTYLNDNNDTLPAQLTWPGTTVAPVLYPKYISSRKVFLSPFDPRPSIESDLDPSVVPISYSINANMYAAPPGVNRGMASVVSPASTILMAPNYPSPTGDPKATSSWPGYATSAPNLPVGGTGETIGTHANGRQINALFCDSHIESLTFGPAANPGTFQDTLSDPLGLKHWDPTK